MAAPKNLMNQSQLEVNSCYQWLVRDHVLLAMACAEKGVTSGKRGKICNRQKARETHVTMHERLVVFLAPDWSKWQRLCSDWFNTVCGTSVLTYGAQQTVKEMKTLRKCFLLFVNFFFSFFVGLKPAKITKGRGSKADKGLR